ncbi:MAG: hypothetical protein HGA90_04955 [Alphaproteobacteria bacterium]|nr:hypothetical protein [Alphaproteobacteria bacterium]
MNTDTIVIILPLKPRRRAGRKYLIAPDGATTPATGATPQLQTMQKALVRAHLWRKEIENGPYDSITHFARKNRQDDAYVLRQLSLTFLAPAVVEAILENTQPRYLTLQQLYHLVHLDWDQQKKTIPISAD